MANLTPRPDDRTYEQLVDLLRRQLPTDEHTDHNPSDPGIMLNELLSWLGEMVLYRMNRVPESHEARFLDFLIDPPEPVTVEMEFIATFQSAPATAVVTIPAGTLVATDYLSGRRFVFETIRSVELRRPDLPEPPVVRGSVTARAIREIFNEPLGISDGEAHQVFALRPPRQALGIGGDAPAPILTDFVHRTATYEPNPRVDVGAEHWSGEPSLLTERARIGGSELGKRYMVDANESVIRFGDGVFGAIPPSGALVSATRYVVLDGPAALTVGESAVTNPLNLSLPIDVTVAIRNSDAEGGAHFHPVSRRNRLGLGEFRAPYRLVTTSDFERAILADFNAFQALSGRTPSILRAVVAFNRRPPLEDAIDAPGNVTVLLIAGSPQFDEAQYRDESIAVPVKQAMLAVSDALWRRLRRFLEPRRLITTRLHPSAPTVRPFTMTATVGASADRNLARVETELRERVYGFLSLISGGFDGRGWPLGRDVFRSQLFRLLEEADGVDHVEALALDPVDAQGNVHLAPDELPLLQSLILAVTRA